MEVQTVNGIAMAVYSALARDVAFSRSRSTLAPVSSGRYPNTRSASRPTIGGAVSRFSILVSMFFDLA
jgi:hypothetical protein